MSLLHFGRGQGSLVETGKSLKRLLNLPISRAVTFCFQTRHPTCSPGLRALAGESGEEGGGGTPVRELRSKETDTAAVTFPHSGCSVEVGGPCADGMSNICFNRETRCCSPSQLFASMTARGTVPCPGARVSHTLAIWEGDRPLISEGPTSWLALSS